MQHEALGNLALNKGDFQEAVNIFRRAIDETKSVDAWTGLALAYLGLEELATARWAGYKALGLDPKHPRASSVVKKIEEHLAAARANYPVKRHANFRTRANIFERRLQKTWQPFFVKGINLGLAVPGYYPGEYPIGKKQYRRWFEQMAAAGFNTIRIYTLQSPSFYEALAAFNESGRSLYLIQGIWIEPPEDNNFSGGRFLHYVRGQISDAVNIIFGDAVLPEKAGHPHGSYKYDVSHLTLGFLFGSEWESCTVGAYNELKKQARTSSSGTFLSISGATPFELWIYTMLEELLIYEDKKYGITHPVSTVNWPPLDPLVHPSESAYEPDGQRHTAKRPDCFISEDVESLDTAKIAVKKGNGFFASYHVYPYHPDFMSNDFLDREKPYSAYLGLLKSHHGKQPVLIAEFGVPGSRDIAHWHSRGWHHGGHDESEQGRINGEMIKAIHETGMAGGILFSWFDEWFKHVWLFSQYELPADRNVLWLNFQDAEQAYGLIAAYPHYPGKKVSLAGDRSEWRDATVLYNNSGAPAVRFPDGANGARGLQSLAVQHDEGFLYLALTTFEAVNFAQGHYIIGIDTCDPNTGEFLLPFNLGIISPVGLKFLIHLTGPQTSRILVCANYDRHLNDPRKDIWPQPSRDGGWVLMDNLVNRRRMSKDKKKFYPARIFSMSALRHGSLNPKDPEYNSLADFHVAGNLIELRIPWGLLMVTDPSSRTVYWKQGGKLTCQTEGFRFLAFSLKPEGRGFMAAATGKSHNATDILPRVMERHVIRTYAWKEWNVPLYHFYEKRSLTIYKNYLAELG